MYKSGKMISRSGHRHNNNDDFDELSQLNDIYIIENDKYNMRKGGGVHSNR